MVLFDECSENEDREDEEDNENDVTVGNIYGYNALNGEDVTGEVGHHNDVNGSVAARSRGKYRAPEPIGEDDDIDSVYYDSDNPPSYQSEVEQEEAELQPDLTTKKHGNSKYPYYKPDSEIYDLEKGKFYDDAPQFRKAAIDYAVHFKRDIGFYKNDPGRVMLICNGVRSTEGEKCPFKCTCSWEEVNQCFQIKTLEPQHMCNQQYFFKIVSQGWIEQKYENKIRKNTDIGHVELKDHIEAELKITVSIFKVRRAIRAVPKKINAGFKDQFKKIRDYAQECLNSNPGSTVKVLTQRTTPDSPCVFQRIYVCFDALKKGFLGGCRRIIGLDGCFLKGLLKGEILTAVGRDANNQMYPIAWAVVEIENTDSWRWFLQLLKSDLDITNTYLWTICSDQQKGLTNVIQQLFPDAEHRNCARHVHANWSKKHKGLVMKNHFWMLAKSTTEEQFQKGLAALGRKDKAAKDDLDRYPAKFWCKAFFRTEVKCDQVDNNLCEAYNATLVRARCKPIIPMLEEIRVAAMKRIAKKRKFVDTWNGNYGPAIMKKITENRRLSVGWEVAHNGADGYEIKKDTHHFKVKLQNKTCSCRSWELSGIPCPHAICAILDQGGRPEAYIDLWYSKEAYIRTYNHTLEPVNGEIFWPKTNSDEIHAPVPKKMTGRPKKKRKLEASEAPSTGNRSTKLTRKGRIMKCSICKSEGHRRPNCPVGRAPPNVPTQ